MSAFFQHYKILIITTIIVLGLSIWYIMASVTSVNRYVKQFNETYGVKDEEPGGQVNLYRVPGYHELLKEKGLLNSLIKLAKSDSVGLFLDLSDSVAQLMIKGVAVRDIPLREIKLPSLFSRTSQEALYEWLSEPVKTRTLKTTIPKEPLNVVQAPKDSSDVIPSAKPDTTASEPVFFMLNSNRNLRLYFYQVEGDGDDFWAGINFEWTDRWLQVKKNIHAVFTFQFPDYIPTLRIGVTKEDAKVLYRALPEHSEIVITY